MHSELIFLVQQKLRSKVCVHLRKELKWWLALGSGSTSSNNSNDSSLIMLCHRHFKTSMDWREKYESRISSLFPCTHARTHIHSHTMEPARGGHSSRSRSSSRYVFQVPIKRNQFRPTFQSSLPLLLLLPSSPERSEATGWRGQNHFKRFFSKSILYGRRGDAA